VASRRRCVSAGKIRKVDDYFYTPYQQPVAGMLHVASVP